MSQEIETWDLILTEAGLTAAVAAKNAGFSVDITHLAAGDAGYSVQVAATGRTTATALQSERQRVEISEAVDRGVGQTTIAAVFDGDGDFYVRELGLFLDDGTLYAVASHPTQAMMWKSAISAAYVSTDLTLGASDPDNVQIVVGGAPIQLVTADIREDLSGLHDPDGQFNFGLVQSIESQFQTTFELFEQMAQIRRGYGQSGVRFGRHYSMGGDAAYHRPGAVSFSAFGVHNHSNYELMCGLPEITAVINGYEINTRHIDYRIVNSVAGGGYLEVASATPPAVPPSVAAQATPEAQTAEMGEYLRAFALRDPSIRDYRPHFDVYMSVLECWIEVWDDDEVNDTFSSFRHEIPSRALRASNDDFNVLLQSGLKPRFENNDFKPTTISYVGADGRPHIGVLRYRAATVRLGTYEDFPVHDMVSQVDDPATRQRKGLSHAELGQTRSARYRVNHRRGDPSIGNRNAPSLLDELMRHVPGLDGPGNVIAEKFTDTNDVGVEFQQTLKYFRQDEPLNANYYTRHYSFVQPGAAGRRDYRFGYNDPNMFRAATTRAEVVEMPGMGGGHRYSWAIPLELIVATPLSSWNPHNVPISDASGGDGKSAQTPYTNARTSGRWYLTPPEVFAGVGSGGDPADTSDSAWMRCGDGQARRLRASGVYVTLPPIAGVPDARIRYPIAPVHHEGSFEFGHIEAVRRETQEAIAELAQHVVDLKLHTAKNGGNNGN